ncbi:Crp/Fnr family transcriptional regulator [Laspinema sp. A4]|uniref:Crp/Fnr family transcriptional regulator n=1 Tax=Laspinema sp. D2d TaxID=2953686 RepID=UPI0021BB7B85|nr:Crp/Fnr family transcriptional regulator [Laspinema sp. D2d]MCT7986579.1 Crp/Fnr family transcriptional regulator [Laspinema sp. D2d]
MTVSPLELKFSEQLRQSAFTKRSLLPLNPRSLWKIETGVVRSITWFEDGTSITLGIWGPGDIVGRSLSRANPYHLECLTRVEATLISKEKYDHFTDALILHSQRLEEFLEIVHTKPVDVSFLRFLTWLGQRFGQENESGQLIQLGLTHQEIGEMIGSSRVTVTRLFKELEQQGILQRLHRKQILLHETQPWWHYEI